MPTIEEKKANILDLMTYADREPDGVCVLYGSAYFNAKAIQKVLRDIEMRSRLGAETLADQFVVGLLAENMATGKP